MEIMVFLGIISAANLLIFALILFFKKRSSTAHKFLSAILVIFAGVHIDDILVFTGIAWKYHYVNEIIHTLFFLLGPFYLMYTRSMVGKKVNINRRVMFLHALPMLFGVAYFIHINIKSSEEIKHIYDTMKESPFDGMLIISFITAIQMGIYLLLSLRMVNQYNKTLPAEFKNILGLCWLRNLTIYLILLCYFIAPILILISNTNSWWLYAFQPLMTTVIYFMLYHKSVTFMNIEELKALKLQQQKIIQRRAYADFEQRITNIIELSEDEAGKEEVRSTDIIFHHASKLKKAFYDLIYTDKYH